MPVYACSQSSAAAVMTAVHVTGAVEIAFRAVPAFAFAVRTRAFLFSGHAPEKGFEPSSIRLPWHTLGGRRVTRARRESRLAAVRDAELSPNAVQGRFRSLRDGIPRDAGRSRTVPSAVLQTAPHAGEDPRQRRTANALISGRARCNELSRPVRPRTSVVLKHSVQCTHVHCRLLQWFSVLLP